MNGLSGEGIVSRVRKTLDGLKIREKRPVIDKFREFTGGNPVGKKELVQSFRAGIAESLGIPTELLPEQNVRDWITTFIKSFVKPEQYAAVAPNEGQVKQLGTLIGMIMNEGLSARDKMVQGQTHAQETSRKRLLDRISVAK